MRICPRCGGSGHVLRPQPKKLMSFVRCTRCGGKGLQGIATPIGAEGELRTARWLEISFEILISRSVSRNEMRRMHPFYAEESAGYRVRVPNGMIRNTSCGMIECRDHRGMPFGWNKKLVLAVLDLERNIVWP